MTLGSSPSWMEGQAPKAFSTQVMERGKTSHSSRNLESPRTPGSVGLSLRPLRLVSRQQDLLGLLVGGVRMRIAVHLGMRPA